VLDVVEYLVVDVELEELDDDVAVVLLVVAPVELDVLVEVPCEDDVEVDVEVTVDELVEDDEELEEVEVCVKTAVDQSTVYQTDGPKLFVVEFSQQDCQKTF
jgi:hypothetical protein